MCAELLDLYDTVYAALGGTPTDAEILAAMLDAIGKPVRRYQSDFSTLQG